jgi:ATP-dependent Lon protease
VGGDIIFVEASIFPGKGQLVLTGQLGEVMKESARAGLTYATTHHKELGVAQERFKDVDVHVHVPAGAVPKEGPSAGITMATAMLSAFTEREVSRSVAMTGEITLRGNVLPVGGVKEKVLAARRSGLKTVVLPEPNRKNLEEIPKALRRDIRFVFARHVQEVFEVALSSAGGAGRKGGSRASREPLVESTP